ncbi:hypothetical protein CEQ90_20645 [Lewinellaceae bacterium SD302]|nr:hypothetical protein CEQ90_20645 [Lewinellaceae bacterium SD302]
MARVPITCAVSDNGGANAAAPIFNRSGSKSRNNHARQVTLGTNRQPAVDGGAMLGDATTDGIQNSVQIIYLQSENYSQSSKNLAHRSEAKSKLKFLEKSGVSPNGSANVARRFHIGSDRRYELILTSM